MDMLAIILGLVVLMALTLKKVPVIFAGVISVVVVACFSGMPVVETVTETYIDGISGYVARFWWLILFGTILSQLMDVSGAAHSIAMWIIGKMGVKLAILSIILAGGLLTYGGVSSVVSSFALYPITLAVFRKANLPRYLIPATIASGIFTWSSMLPGTPADQNIMPTTYLGTTPMAAPIIGILAALVTLVLSFWYLNYEASKAAKAGIGFVADEAVEAVLAQADELEKKGTLPNPLLAVLPLICVMVLLNVLMLNIAVALVAGILLVVIFFHKNIDGLGKNIKEALEVAAVTVMTASAVVGLGSVIKVAPGFQKIVDFILNFAQSGGNPLIIFAIATTVLCGLNASGTGGLTTTLSVLSEPFLAMGVSAPLIHRIGVIASVGLDTMPHSGGIVTLLSISDISYKDGYKHLAVTTIVITLISLAVSLVLASILGPI